MTVKVVSFNDLPTSDLIVDAVYEGAAGGQLSGEALGRTIPGIGNLGGFRFAGKGQDKKLVILYTSGEDGDWPDELDTRTGRFVYFGDNKTPGHQLHDTTRGGNKILNRVFDLSHQDREARKRVPPFFVFQKFPTEISTRSVQFKGLAVPGHPGLSSTQDLIAVWKSKNGQRFQNYRAVFTILDEALIDRRWIGDVLSGSPLSEWAPKSWSRWVEDGVCEPLVAESTLAIRTVEEQMPNDPLRSEILRTVWEHFTDQPLRFEAFAARLFRMMDARVSIDLITRASVDGGRDAIGRYALGLESDPVFAEFSLEAKCYRPGLDGEKINTVGVKETSRLISRIRHREFGVLVTTSAVGKQAYSEIREDRHPIILIAGKDISDVLINNGLSDAKSVQTFLDREFPRRDAQ